MISSICIEYNLRNTKDWKLYKYATVGPEESGTSEIITLERAFGEYFNFRVIVNITHPVVLKMYDAKTRDWIEVK